MDSLGREAVALLKELIGFDTVNPPGDELPAQEHLRAILSDAGFECELLGAQPRRPNLVARLRAERVTQPAAGRRAGAGGPRAGGLGASGVRAGVVGAGGLGASGVRASGVRASGGPFPGRTDGPTLCYLGHVDTVLADPAEWRHDPWSGQLADGCVWGRGALDMKSQVAAEVAAAASLARSGWRPARGELLIVSVVDEETGGSLGAEWLTATHPEKVRCDLLVNEGGGAVFEYAGKRLYGVCCAEKGVFRFTLTTDGVAGHASMPKVGDNALLKMAPLLARLGARQPSYELTPEPAAFLRGIGEDPDDPAGALARLARADPRLATMFEPMFGVTFVPTRIRASEKINVIPSRAELKVDCRVPPGLGEPQVRRAIAEILGEPAGLGGDTGLGGDAGPGGDGRPGGDRGPGRAGEPGRGDGFRVDFTERVIGNRSPLGSPLMDAIAAWIAARDPGAEVVPVILPGFTDSRHFRAAFPECVAYGFFPQRHQSLPESSPLIHAADERIDVRDVAFAAEFFSDLARSLLGGDESQAEVRR